MVQDGYIPVYWVMYGTLATPCGTIVLSTACTQVHRPVQRSTLQGGLVKVYTQWSTTYGLVTDWLLTGYGLVTDRVRTGYGLYLAGS